MLPINQMLLTNQNRPKKKLLSIKGVVIHWTANTSKGSTAVANRNYFQNTDRSCSAHYCVDDKQIVQCVPDDEVAYHVGATSYTAIGKAIAEQRGSSYYGPNFFTIGIEVCVNSDGDFKKALKNAEELAASLLKKYKLTTDKLYRHNDITGKNCPAMMTTPALWDSMVKELKADNKPVAHLQYYPWDTVKKEVNGLMAEQNKPWEQVTGEKALDELAKKGKITNPESWKAKDLKNEPTPLWLFFEMFNRMEGK